MGATAEDGRWLALALARLRLALSARTIADEGDNSVDGDRLVPVVRNTGLMSYEKEWPVR